MKGFVIKLKSGTTIQIIAEGHEESPERAGWETFYGDDGEAFLSISKKHVKGNINPVPTWQPPTQIIFR